MRRNWIVLNLDWPFGGWYFLIYQNIWLLYKRSNWIYFGITITITQCNVLGFNFQFTIQMALLPFHFFYSCPHTIAQRQILTVLFFLICQMYISFLLLSSSFFNLLLTPTHSLSPSPQYRIHIFYISFCIYIHKKKWNNFFILLQSPLWSLWNVSTILCDFFIFLVKKKKKMNRNERSETCLCLCKP